MARVLVVDDIVWNSAPIVRLLTNVGFDARYVLSGMDALVAMDSFRPDVVLLDVTMPEMDGFEVLRLIRGDSRHDGVAVLMYTAISTADSQMRAFGLGAQGYIVKGTPFADLRAEVQRHLPPA